MNDTAGGEPLDPARTLAVYGTLAPGESNHWVMDGLVGQWQEVSLRGERFVVQWDAATRYPGFRADPAGPLIPALVFESTDLADHWDRIDAFEGPGYRRITVDVFNREGSRRLGQADVYEARREYWQEIHPA